jgi:hypothetical protein
MRQLILTIVTLLVASCGFASSLPTASASKQSNALRSAWTNHNSSQAQQRTNDITIVYGGADVSHGPDAIAPVALG